MPRALRDQGQDAIYHIWSRGNARQTVFHSDEDYLLFLRILELAVIRHSWLCHAFCAVPNHYHLLIETPVGNLSCGMKFLNGVFTQAYNRAHERTGHLFEGRFNSKLVFQDSYFLVLTRYIVLNPVHAGLVSAPSEWKYSSYASTCGQGTSHSFLSKDRVLSMFADAGRPRESYRDFVLEGMSAAALDEATLKSFGNELGHLESNDSAGTSQTMDKEQPPFDLEEPIFKKADRDRQIFELFMSQQYTQRQIAERFGIHYTTVGRIISRRLQQL